MEIRVLSHTTQAIGQIIHSSKKRHVWVLEIAKTPQVIELHESQNSGKIRVFVDQKQIYESKPSDFDQRFGLNFEFSLLTLSFRRKQSGDFALIIQSEELITDTVIQIDVTEPPSPGFYFLSDEAQSIDIPLQTKQNENIHKKSNFCKDDICDSNDIRFKRKISRTGIL